MMRDPQASPTVPPTELAYQYDGKLLSLSTVVLSVRPLAAVEDANRQLFSKQVPGSSSEADQDSSSSSPSSYYVVVTEKTIFHPQGGGQPADEGTMASASASASAASAAPDSFDVDDSRTGTTASPEVIFHVLAVRMDALGAGHALHLGRFGAASSPAEPNDTGDDDNGSKNKNKNNSTLPSLPVPISPFRPGQPVLQRVDAAARLLCSRLHTAGHVLGAAVRHLLQDEVPGFDELKASHFPGAAACEFRGLIEGARWKAPIQARVDDYVARAMPVEVDWWGEEDFRREGLERLIPSDPALLELAEAGRGQKREGEGGEEGGKVENKGKKGKFRVVKIVGAEAYPCGGTHVESTDLCGQTTVKKISRSKGVSRVSYSVD